MKNETKELISCLKEMKEVLNTVDVAHRVCDSSGFIQFTNEQGQGITSEEANKLECENMRKGALLYLQILELADVALITGKGLPNYLEHSFLSLHGFTVTPGEMDSFGWLSGIIHFNGFKIVYG